MSSARRTLRVWVTLCFRETLLTNLCIDCFHIIFVSCTFSCLELMFMLISSLVIGILNLTFANEPSAVMFVMMCWCATGNDLQDRAVDRALNLEPSHRKPFLQIQ